MTASALYRIIKLDQNADSALYYGILGYNMYAYCNNNPVMYVDPYGESAAAFLGGWISTMTPIALAEPTLIGEAVLLSGIALLLVPVLVEVVVTTISSVVSKAEEAPKSVGEDNSANELRTKEEADPNRRAGQKKQGRENKSKSRQNDGWKSRNNRRDGREARPPKKNTPGKDHKKRANINAFKTVF